MVTIEELVRLGPSECVHLLEEVMLEEPFWQRFAQDRRRPYAFLLDSAKEMEDFGSYSFLGCDPFLVFEARRLPGRPDLATIQVARLRDGPGAPSVASLVGDPFALLQRLLREHAVDASAFIDCPVPFRAGAVGYVAYEAAHFIERLPHRAVDDVGLPDILFGFYDTVLAHDQASDAMYLSVVGRGPTEAVARQRARELRDARLAELREPAPGVRAQRRPARVDPQRADTTGRFDRASYARAVKACKEHIFCGDAFEICLTHRLEAPFAGDAWELYGALRSISPAPFACYLNLPGAQVVSASPERFLRLGGDRVAESRPIKGTRPRGATLVEDSRLRAELASSVKDRAENMMIVDLVRNDFGRVCEIGTVEVPRLMAVERYATLFQLTSTVRGVLASGRDGVDLMRAAFPGGSMTGAPKIEAMKIIDGLEPLQRGIYSGSIGYLDLAGGLDLSIVIRTIVVNGDRCTFGVGGAIVADSDPGAEYDETMDKAYALKLALATVRAT